MEFNPGDVIHIQVTKADIKQDAGLKLEYRKDECYYVKSIGGLFKRRETPLIVGDKLLTLNGEDMDTYQDLDDCHRAIKSEMKVMLCVERQDPDDEQASVDDNNVNETGLVVREDSDEEYEDEEGVDVQFGNGTDGAIIPHHDETDSPRAPSKRIVPGELRVLDGIEADPDLNGQYVKVIEKDSDKKGRWLVELTDTEKVISVSGKKLARMAG